MPNQYNRVTPTACRKEIENRFLELLYDFI